MFEKIAKPVRIYQEVAEKIEEAIVAGKLKPGDRLPNERDLAQTFGISQRTLREALRVVEEKGLLETSQTGNVVKMITTDVISQNLNLLIKFKKISWQDMLQFRLDLDILVTGRAAAFAKKSDVERIENIVTEMENKFKDGSLSWERFHELDQQIHLILAQLAGNPMHEWVLRTVIDNFSRHYFEFRNNEDEFIKGNLETFQHLLKALRNRDVEAARQAARDHVLFSAGHIEGLGLRDFSNNDGGE